MLRIRLEQLHAEGGDKAVKRECEADHANLAAGNGYLEAVQLFRKYSIHCTANGADLGGHVEVLRDLLAHGIRPETRILQQIRGTWR